MGKLRLTTAQALVKFLDNQYLEVDGVELKFVKGIFAIFGHGNVLGLGQALEQDSGDMRVYQGRNEQGMAHAATGFARQALRRQIIACTSSIGPGAANMITAAGTASANRIPLLLLPGDVFATRQPDPVLQQIEQSYDLSISTNDAFRAVSKYWDRITRPEQLMSACINAMRVLTDPAETGAVTLCLPQDVQAALDKARQEEPWPLAKSTLDLLWSNLSAAKEENLPICQDTGMACVFVELGTDVHIDGSFEAAIHEGVRRGYTDGYLRKSIVADPLRRGNTGDNTPAAITVHLVDGEGCRITVAPKGFGSENMSQIKMLKPADGVEGFKKFVLDTVKLAGSNPCPPIVLGIGVGGSFDKVAYLAKKALLRPLDVPNPDPYYADLEKELLTAINELGIGPQGFGGRTTCLGLAIEQMPTHVAGLPVAVNVSCHVTRRASAAL